MGCWSLSWRCYCIALLLNKSNDVEMNKGCEDDDPIEDETDAEMRSAAIDENNNDNNDDVFED